MAETLSRIRWAQAARDNGWNVILREVVAGPNMAADERKLYNRMHAAIMDADFGLLPTGLFLAIGIVLPVLFCFYLCRRCWRIRDTCRGWLCC